jgi:pyruvate dehydrogenase complex dehydrogenase (E1) component
VLSPEHRHLHTIDRSSRHEVLRRIEQRVLWLSTRIVHHASLVRLNPSGVMVKVGGHQPSSASLATIMLVLCERRDPQPYPIAC